MWNYWQVKYLAIRSGNAIGENCIGGFEYCGKKPVCMLFYNLNGMHLFWRYLRDSPSHQIKATTKYTMYVYGISSHCCV